MAKRRVNAKSNVTASLRSIVKYFELLPDPRHERNQRHLLKNIITISVCGVIFDCEGPTSIHAWAKAKETWLKRFLELPRGIPSRDCIRRVLTVLKPEAFQRCFESCIASLVSDRGAGKGIVAIDGKTLRRSHDQKTGLGPLHLVSAWALGFGCDLRRGPQSHAQTAYRGQPLLATPLRDQSLETSPVQEQHQREEPHVRLERRVSDASPYGTRSLMCAGPARGVNW